MQDNIATITGESLGIRGSVPFTSPLPLDFAVSKETCGKIWANEYVEIGGLLDPFQVSQSKITVQKAANGDSSLCLMPANKKVPKSINEWTSAFAIFSSVYIKKFPNKGGKLLKYGELVRRIAHDGGDFHGYDVSFRKLKQTLPLSWDHFHCELYLKAFKGANMSFTSNQNTASYMGGFRRNVPQGGINRLQWGFCFHFLRGQPCDGLCGY